ncbi:lipopolysaccharide biosynthesis protein [Citrobacter sp. Cf039]|uniref:lipopolysaccharide biosynthesis protein n=1 Tax=Citrobacter TaxID=544 RepID=UPI001C705DCE|nr:MULTISPECIES: lipopolysaccharide biosynthesis protein [Citrobacter]EJB5573598.1 lipopolysaccharide biosynthesis protein [Citrobacter freundii]MBW9589677.1 lipopolysaccharide biosynthesis protein [Citrobacter freundii]MDM3266908.1 lipopolysaccharide biosynthesis protein [Citrobacter sp. Cf039]MDM3344541.1 lipopolysaccharide biosynthesis protein [Citrobacter sp. Cf115]MDS0959118.1 lipopolysaccharide biosynthesis protein [Citrobacter freundii]
MSELFSKTKSGFLWSAIERLLSQIMQFAIMLVLARYLGPTALGLIGMLVVFIGISNVFIDSGFSSALIRKQDRSEDDLTTAFFYNTAVSFICYITLYFCAPYISSFYHQPELTPLLRVIALTVLINSLSLIPRVNLSVEMNFKVLAKVSVISVFFSGLISIIMAMNSYGVWALVAQILSFAFFTTLLLNLFSPWVPKGKIRKESFIYLFGFGGNLLISGLLDVLYNNLYQIIIGKKFNPVAVGEFTQANQMSSIPAMTLMSIIQRVVYPLLSQMQNAVVKMEDVYYSITKMTAIVVFPLILGLAIVAKPLLSLLLGQDWQNAASLISILCFGYMLYPIHAMSVNILQVKGRSDLFLRLEIIKKIIGISILIFTTPFGIVFMCIGLSVSSYIHFFINIYFVAKVTNIKKIKQLRELGLIWSAVVVSATMAYMIGFNWQNTPILQLLITLTVAMTLYTIYLILLQRAFLSKFHLLLKR